MKEVPDIFGRSLPTQYVKLIVEPLEAMHSAQIGAGYFVGGPAVIVLDGLDQCRLQAARHLILDTIIRSPPIVRVYFKFTPFVELHNIAERQKDPRPKRIGQPDRKKFGNVRRDELQQLPVILVLLITILHKILSSIKPVHGPLFERRGRLKE